MKACTDCLLLLTGLATVLFTGCQSRSLSQIATRSAGHTPPFAELPAGIETDSWTLKLGPGNTRDAVLTQFGVPDAALGHGAWIYNHASSSDRALDSHGDYDTLLVTFDGEHVSSLRLVNGTQLRDTIARFEKGGGIPATAVARSL